MRDVGALVSDYKAQLMHNMTVTGAKAATAGSFDDRLSPGLDWISKAVQAADLPMAEYQAALGKFLYDVDSMEAELRLMQKIAA